MTIPHLTIAMAIAAGLICSSASAWDQYPFDQYLQRRDTVTLDAGNAKAANTATHMINPWPPYVFDRRIPGNGERMTGAVERYRNVARIPGVPCPIVPQFDAQLGIRSAGSVSGQCGSTNIGATGPVNQNNITVNTPGTQPAGR
jgi:hypothetical protein